MKTILPREDVSEKLNKFYFSNSSLLGCGSSMKNYSFSNSTQKLDIGVGVGMVKNLRLGILTESIWPKNG